MAKSKPKKSVAPALITKLGGHEIREFGGGQIGEINRTASEKNYAAEDGVTQSTIGDGVMMSKMKKLTQKEWTERIAELFPEVDPGEEALDCYVIVQELLVPKKRGSFIITSEQLDADQIVTSFAKVRSIGPMCFKQDVTGDEFPGGQSFAVGDIVRVPKIGNQEFAVDEVIFNYWKDRDVKGKITDLRKIVAMYF